VAGWELRLAVFEFASLAGAARGTAVLVLLAFAADGAAAGFTKDDDAELVTAGVLPLPGTGWLAPHAVQSLLAPTPVLPEVEVRREPAAAGQDRLRLSARASADTGVIQRPVGWTVFRAAAHGALPVARTDDPEPILRLEPGRYRVRADYGLVCAEREIEVDRGLVTDATFVLNVGALRMLSRLEGLAAPEGIAATHEIHRAGEASSRAALAISSAPGEIVRLGAGDYVIVSRYGEGNASLETGVTVRAGFLTAMQFEHAAGIARLTLGRPASGGVTWRIRDAQGETVAVTRQDAPVLVLLPGAYTAVLEGEEVSGQWSFTAIRGIDREIVVGW
jgi:hypothetical protein